MDFNEEKAREIVEKFNLDEKTIKVWKSRNKIPDKYGNPDFKPTEKITSNSDIVLSERVFSVFNMKEINLSTLCQLSNISNFQDIKGGRSSMTVEQLLNAKKEINRLKSDIVNSINKEFLFKKIIFDKRIKYYPILRYTLADNEIKQLVWQAEKTTFDRVLLQKARDAFVKFAVQLNL